jgi:hypothetical protein
VQAFKARVAESEQAEQNLKAKLTMVNKEIKDQNGFIDKLKAAIRAKGPPLKVSQTRLEKRSHRVENENCNDAPHIKIVEEVGTIHANIEHLNNKLAEAHEAKQVMRKFVYKVVQRNNIYCQDLLAVQHRLELDIGVKGNSLRIDKHKCLGIRLVLLSVKPIAFTGPVGDIGGPTPMAVMSVSVVKIKNKIKIFIISD